MSTDIQAMSDMKDEEFPHASESLTQSSIVEHLPSIGKALGSSPNTEIYIDRLYRYK